MDILIANESLAWFNNNYEYLLLFINLAVQTLWQVFSFVIEQENYNNGGWFDGFYPPRREYL